MASNFEIVEDARVSAMSDRMTSFKTNLGDTNAKLDKVIEFMKAIKRQDDDAPKPRSPTEAPYGDDLSFDMKSMMQRVLAYQFKEMRERAELRAKAKAAADKAKKEREELEQKQKRITEIKEGVALDYAQTGGAANLFK
jgi:hypothetical protein